MKKPTQRERVLAALNGKPYAKDGFKVSNFHCSAKWRPAVLRVGGIIHNLRRDGYNILSEKAVTPDGASTVNYILEKEEELEQGRLMWSI